MVIIAAEGEGLPIAERRKNAETLKKISESILLHEEKMKVYEKESDRISYIFNQLQIIIVDEITQVKNKETGKVLENILDRLKSNIENISTEEDD